MSPRTPEQNRAIREQRRDEIERAAAGLLLEKGYAAIRMDDVAHAAGVSKGTLYRHFDSKDDLFVQSLRHLLDGIIDPIRAMASHRGDPAAALEQMAELAVTAALEADQTWRVVFAGAGDPHLFDLLKEDLARVYEQLVDAVEDLFYRLGRPDPRAHAFLFIAAIDGLAFPPMLGVRLPSAHRMANAAGIIIHGRQED